MGLEFCMLSSLPLLHPAPFHHLEESCSPLANETGAVLPNSFPLAWWIGLQGTFVPAPGHSVVFYSRKAQDST